MTATTLVLTLALFAFATANMVPESNHFSIDSIDISDITVDHMAKDIPKPKEAAKFAAISVETGFARTTSVGLTVQKGTSGVLRFRIRVLAVVSERLARQDAVFTKTLTKAELRAYNRRKAAYNNGLDIPFLHDVGINADKGADEQEIRRAAARIANYEEKASAARFLLSEAVTQRIDISGSLKAHGVSYIPTTVFAFIKLAKVKTFDGTFLNVVSAHPGDVEAASDNGQVVPSDGKSLNLVKF